MPLTPGVLAVARRELRRMSTRILYPLLVVVLPLVSFALLWIIFSAGTIRNLPVAVVDLDGSPLSRQLVRMLEVTRTLSAGIEIRRLEAAGMPRAQALVARDPLPVVDRALFNPAEGYASYIVPSILVLILQQTLLIGIGLLAGTAREQDGVAPTARPLTVVLGRTLAYFGLYLMHAVFYFFVVYKIFGFPQRGNTATTLVFAVPFLLAAILLALAVSTVFRHRETALQVLLFTSLPAVFLAGFSWPKEMIPGWLNSVSLLIPSTPAIAGFLRINQMGASLSDVAFEWKVLWCLVGAYFALAWWANGRVLLTVSTPEKSSTSNLQHSTQRAGKGR